MRREREAATQQLEEEAEVRSMMGGLESRRKGTTVSEGWRNVPITCGFHCPYPLEDLAFGCKRRYQK